MENETLTLRRARRGDRDGLGALWMALLEEQAALDVRFAPAPDALERWRNDFPAWLHDERRRLVVAAHAGEPVGFVSAERWTSAPVYAASAEVFIDELYVRPAWRRRGLGSRLVQEIEAWADELGAERLRLRVLEANEAGRPFWARHGAKPFATTLTIERERPASASAPTSEEERRGRLGF